VVASVLAVDIWLFFIHGIGAAALQVLTNPLLLLLLLTVGFISGIWHELGHSTACRYGGASPGRIGMGIFLIWPCFYSDVTDTYRLGKRGRLRTDLGGVYFNCIGVLVLSVAYAVTGFEPLLVVIMYEQLEILIQGLPFLRLDGYYVVTDLVGVPDLFGRIIPILKSLVPGAVPGPKVTELKPRVRVVVTVWVAVTTVVLSAGAVFFVLYLPLWVGVSAATFSARVNNLSRSLNVGDYPSALLSFVQAGMILIPFFGMSLLASRIIKLRRKAAAGGAGTNPMLLTARPSASSAGVVAVVLVGAAGALGLAVALVQAPWVYALVVAAVLCVGVLWAMLRWTATGGTDDRRVARWTYASFVLHLALGLGGRASGQVARFVGGAGDTVHQNALSILDHWSSGTPLRILDPAEAGFSYGLARLYQLVGPHLVAGLALVSLCSALVVVLVADTTRRLFGPRARLAVLPLLVLLPGLLLWTAQLVREVPMLVALALAVNLAVRLSQQATPGRLVVLGATVAALFALRPTVAYVVAAGLVVGLLVAGRQATAGVVAVTAAACVVFLLALGGAVAGSGYERPGTAGGEPPTAGAGQGIAAPDASAVPVWLADLPSDLPQLLLGPASTQGGGLARALGLLEVLTLWCLLPSLVRGLGRGRRLIGRRAGILLVPAVALTVALTLLLGSSGPLVPERLQVLVLLLPFIAVGRVRAAHRRPKRGARAELVAGEGLPQPTARPELTPPQLAVSSPVTAGSGMPSG